MLRVTGCELGVENDLAVSATSSSSAYHVTRNAQPATRNTQPLFP